jgi:hypothetical protein
LAQKSKNRPQNYGNSTKGNRIMIKLSGWQYAIKLAKGRKIYIGYEYYLYYGELNRPSLTKEDKKYIRNHLIEPKHYYK